jgi:hypothetical protein
MKKFTLFLSVLLSLTLITACGGPVDPDKVPLDNSSGMGANSCEQECNQFKKELDKHEDAMLSDAGCEKGMQEGELNDGQATGTLGSGTSYFCPDRTATNTFAEAVSDKSRAHKKALKAYNDNCPCMVQLFQCSICSEGTSANLCIPTFSTKEECEAKGGTVLNN